jgi:hypothetical protein
VQVEYAGIAAMARRLTQEKNASGVRTSYGHMVGYTWTFWKFSLALSFRLFLLKQREEFVAVRVK